MNLIELSDVGVDFVIYQGSGRSLKKTILSAGTGGRLSHDAHHRTVIKALSGISLSLKSGDRLGLIGGNGAGKRLYDAASRVRRRNHRQIRRLAA
jgi:ABC-2 type transport system ATP-binding protein/lipopolysaccharide transport system ATP-binding protein